MPRRLTQWRKQWTRLTRFALHLARGLVITTVLFPFQSESRRKREIKHWSLQLLTLLNLRLHLHGASPIHGDQALMIVANHVSWLDIFVINSIVPSRFVAKAEVRKWPFIGWLSARTGTLFIDRGRRHDTARINHAVSAALGRGDVFAVFPEGTTSDGSTVLKFHASLFEPALESTATVQPLALWYQRSDGTRCIEASFEGGKTLWGSLMAITSQPEIIANVSVLGPIPVSERHRRDIAREARDAILLTLHPQSRGSRTEIAADLQAAVH